MTPTPWGYSVDGDRLAPLMEVDGDDASLANAAAMAVRNFCGWHVAPPLLCVYTCDSEDVTRIVQLPASFVTDVSSVKVGGVDATFKWATNGMVRVDAPIGASDWQDIEVRYTAGLPSDMLAVVESVLNHRIEAAKNSTEGVQSAAVGGVSYTYSSDRANAMAGTLSRYEDAALAPYKVVSV